MANPERKVRWWFPAVVLVLAAGLLIWVWMRPAQDRQFTQVFPTLAVVFFTGVLLFLWLLLFSGMRWRTRLRSALVAFALLALASWLFPFRGFSGDMVPLFGFRFGGGAELAKADPASGPSAEELAETEQDWSDCLQFRGPNGDGVFADVAISPGWSATPPEELWRVPIGEGCSGFAVTGRRAITQMQRDDQEVTVAFDLLTGSELWTHERTARYESGPGGVGPRATPTVHGDLVLSYGGTGVLDALDLATGEARWSHDVRAETNARQADWGVSGSPLIVDENVVVSIGAGNGQSVVAYRLADGERAWAAGAEEIGYGTPRLLELGGVRQIVALHRKNLVSHSVVDGSTLWSAPWDSEQACADVVTSPDGDVFVSSGYSVGAGRFAPRRSEDGSWSVEQVWKSRFLKAKFSNFLLIDGVLYGFDDGIFVAVDAENGRRLWKEGRFGHGQALHVGAHLLVLGEFGELLLIEPNPDELRVVAEVEVFDQKTWNTPTLAAPYLLTRNDSEAVCLRLPIEAP